MEKLDVRHLSLAAAISLGLLYALCVVGHAVLGLRPDWGMFRLFAQTLPGFDPSRPESLLLGGAEVFLYGAVGGALFGAVYNALPSRSAGVSELFPRAHR